LSGKQHQSEIKRTGKWLMTTADTALGRWR
jgi:hypothetical protein